MPAYERSPSSGYHEIDRFSGGVGWLAHPDEVGRRASHAVRGKNAVEQRPTGSWTRSVDGVWLLDPLDAPGVDDLIAEFGEVVGVAVLSNWHARDAGVLARRHDVPVFLPDWMTRVAERIDARVERFSDTLGDSGFRVHKLQPLPGWLEGIAFRESDRTLYVPDSLGTAPGYVVGPERLGVAPSCRFFPPWESLAGFEPQRVLVGHGEGIQDRAARTLEDAFVGARRQLPRALVENGATQLRSLVEALRE